MPIMMLITDAAKVTSPTMMAIARQKYDKTLKKGTPLWAAPLKIELGRLNTL
jgi:hypothetical protein